MPERSWPDSRIVHPPGTILQHLYLKERLRSIPPGRFVEVGVGSGHVSSVLLSLGWEGIGYDLSAKAIERASRVTRAFVDAGRFALRNEDWLATEQSEGGSADLVISSMVLEHLSDAQVPLYFERAASQLRADGRAILFVPGSPRHWGIEDEISGHYRRYTIATLRETVSRQGWAASHVVGLTYPLSNLAMGLSNFLTRRAEASKRSLTLQERTVQSGHREVRWKTEFPRPAGWLLNETVMRPAHWIQKLERCRSSEAAVVIYCECQPVRSMHA